MTRRSQRLRAWAPDPGAPGRECDIPGCSAPGEYRAPKSRYALHDYWWYCLQHVRDYNAAWDFYKGMTPGEIEAHLRADVAWQRPTWPLGRLGSVPFGENVLRDPLRGFSPSATRGQPRGSVEPPSEMREPLATLGLAWPVTMDVLKMRYKELAKLHHPDANNGDRGAEERLKTINIAYAALRGRLAASSPLAAAG
jgi:hypothetical protein